ncbi:uncharacterized protein LOC122022972 [Zingiber officinale]|uniref:uncharacterized protein LOC122022972 n=1 Tax=Zingiber officinale TaxID=94328 RepID=UPI001C4BBEB0|nr:uncharacterized protein LOC122022972 [Zingiber officinale]
MKFQWDEECDRAFEELKAYLNSLPVLAKPIAGEPLKIYLSSTNHAVGSALVRSDGEEQPLYFLNHILKDAESRYTSLEKLAFALVLAARRLRPYFLVHTITVMTNSSLNKVLLNSEASGWLIKWTMELSEFDIQYQPRTAIKGQSLADFITEVQDPKPEVTWKVYQDGSSTRQGSGVGILLISPKEEQMQLSVRLDYQATNNEAEYEALIAGLQAARHVVAIRVLIHSDLQLAVQQLSGTFEINNARLRLYTEAFEKLKANFQEVVIRKVPRAENQAADELAKLASSISPIVMQQPIEQMSLVAHIDWMEGLTFPSDWRTALIEFLQAGSTPSDREEAHLLRRRAGRFTLIRDQLYKKAFSQPLLKCVRPEDIDYILQEVHQGSCGGYPGGRSLARKILMAGYFWPTLQKDTAQTVSTCLSYQKYHNLSHRPTEEMNTSAVSCPFDQWGLDIVGPFPMATSQRKFLLVVVDYFSKWVEVEPLARITEQMVKKFIWQHLICRFGIPRWLISDNGRQFVSQQLREWCEGYGIQQTFTSMAYPQSNGQAEVSNREILRILQVQLDHVGGS